MRVLIDSQALTIKWGDGENAVSAACRIGKGGARPDVEKAEGDGATPLGVYPVRFGMWRADRLPCPESELAFHAITDADLWCDDPRHPAYNRWVRAPFAASHERLMRDDMAYDLLLVMGHNDDPPVAGRGGAVFVHLDRPDHRPTLGCVAVEPDVMIQLIRDLTPGDEIEIV